jgi:hypothetical protein
MNPEILFRCIEINIPFMPAFLLHGDIGFESHGPTGRHFLSDVSNRDTDNASAKVAAKDFNFFSSSVRNSETNHCFGSNFQRSTIHDSWELDFRRIEEVPEQHTSTEDDAGPASFFKPPKFR